MNEALVVATAAPSNRKPIDFEAEVTALPLQGALPPGLKGTLVRNGPDPVIADPREHWFAGDGMLHAFRIGDGQVDYRNRWVRTAHWSEAMARSGAPVAASPLGALPEGVANTHIVAHAGRMLALEEAHLPVAIEPGSLRTLGTEDFGGVGHRLTAHPKTDPESGDLLFFGYGTPDRLSNGMTFGVVSRQGRVTRLENFRAPYASMVHDFAISANHVVFPITPLTASLERAQAGGPPYAWEPEYGTRVGIMPRSAGVAAIEWWSGPACFVFHTANAWEDGRYLHLDVIRFDKPPLFPLPDGTPAAGSGEPGKLVRWTFDREDPTRRDFRQTALTTIAGEFPRIDQRRTGLPYRHVWFAGSAADGTGNLRPQAQLVHLDLAAGAAEPVAVYLFDAPDHISEPVFVARAPDAQEGDGWILATVWRGKTDTSDLVVFDAHRVAAGPVCVATLPHRVPDGFHGNWFPQGEPA